MTYQNSIHLLTSVRSLLEFCYNRQDGLKPVKIQTEMPELYNSPQQPDKEPDLSQPAKSTLKSTQNLKPTANPFAAFCYNPTNVRFETQEDQEKVILLLRQHPIVNLPWIFIAAVLIMAPSVLSVFPLIEFLPPNFQFVAVLFWYLIVTAFVLESALSWFFNIYIVTDERLIDVDFHNLIHKEVTESKIDKVQEITHKVGGVAGTVFNYGTVTIQTAGAVPNLEFQSVPNPAEVVRIIQELRTQEEQEALEGRVR